MEHNHHSYNGNINVKRDGVTQKYTSWEMEEYLKCADSPQYFAETYCKVIHLDRGLVPFQLYGYQDKMMDHFMRERFSIVLACRQSGKSISSVAFLLWWACFKPSQTIAILANKAATAREMLGRITLMLENLPFFLQPGTRALNKGSIEFSNASRIIASATSTSSIRGFAINLLYLDEFAFVEKATEFYTSTYPVITSGTSTKVIITSTANGIGNQFHKIWTMSLQKTNDYKPFRVDWWDVPGRDDEWKRQTVANTSQLQFDQEYGNNFFGTGDTLIDAECLMNLRSREPIERTKDNVAVYAHPEPEHLYILCADVAKGRGQDSSTFSIIDVTADPWQQVAVYRDNKISPLLFPNIIYKYANTYNTAIVVIESNDAGMITCNGLYHDLEYENMYVESQVKTGALGINMDRKVKRIGCSTFKDLLEEGKLEVHDEETIKEISTFEARGQSYEASDGNHDDLVMNLVLMGYFSNTSFFSQETDIDLRKALYNKNMIAIDEDILPFGIIDDGRDYEEERANRELVEKYTPWSINTDQW